MQRILIVDDEKIFRDYLRTAIPWHDYGFTVAGEARNGREALDVIARTHVDIALVDINMPHMDGLQLSETIAKQWPHVRTVIVSGHNEFDYARRAIQIGVTDYLLKPFSKEELMLTLLNLKERIEDDRKEQKTYETLMALWKETYLNHLLMNELEDDEETIVRQLQAFGMDAQGGSWQVACIEIDRIHNSRWKDPAERNLWKFAISNILSETIDPAANVDMINVSEGRMACIIHYVQPAEEERVIQSFERLCPLIKSHLKFTITIGIGGRTGELKNLGVSYREALAALRQKFILGSNRVIVYRQFNGTEDSSNASLPFISGELQERLLRSLRMNDAREVSGILQAVFRTLSEGQRSIDIVYVTCMGLISLCLSCLTDNGHRIEDCFGDQFFPYSEITKKESVEEAFRWIEDCFLRVMDYCQTHRMTRSGKIARQARAYIEAHYGNPDLHLEEIASSVYVNPNYLREIFKKEFGMTVSEYVTYFRMEKAKELIASGHYKLADVAERVGYSDPGYFSKSFKRFFGMKPSEYEAIKKG